MERTDRGFTAIPVQPLFQAGLDGYLGFVTLRASKTGSPPGDLTVELRNVVEDSQEVLDQQAQQELLVQLVPLDQLALSVLQVQQGHRV